MADRSAGNLKILIELAGGGAILVGLIFVGLELRQNTAALSAQAIFQLNDSANEAHRSLAQDPALSELVHKGNEDPESLTDDERRRFTSWLRAVFNNHESAWIYHRKGLIQESDFAGWKGSTCNVLSSDGARWFWANNIGSYADGFVEGVEKWCIP